MKSKVYTQAELDRELKRDMIVDREMDDTPDYYRMENIMNKIENMRRKRKYSQKKLAEKAGIGLSTYKDYLTGISDSIKLKTVINITHVLQCKLSDLIDEEH
ncbi:MAG: helix-turn-helix domain-containing protein [Roseburia sp. 1XD42-69]|jgi:Predicted transcriptional regulator